MLEFVIFGDQRLAVLLLVEGHFLVAGLAFGSADAPALFQYRLFRVQSLVAL